MSLLEFTLGREEEETSEAKMQGIAFAEVIEIDDLSFEGRVKLRLPWMPNVEPWARVATISAGGGYGAYFIPQAGEEVVVAFNQGNIAEPIVLGSLWSTTARPPTMRPDGPRALRVIRTPVGNEIEIDDLTQSITIKTTQQQTVSMTTEGVEVSGPTASIKMSTAGAVEIKGEVSINLDAPTITIGGTVVNIKGKASAELKSNGLTNIAGANVDIN